MKGREIGKPIGIKPRSQMPLRTATNAVRTIFRQFRKIYLRRQYETSVCRPFVSSEIGRWPFQDFCQPRTKQWQFEKTMEKQGDSYEIIVRTNLCDRSIR